MRLFQSVAAGLLALAASSSFAAAPADCPPFGALPSYAASDAPEIRAFDSVDVMATKPGSDETETIQVAGRVCKQAYHAKDGAQPMSDLEIQMNYRDQIGKLGGQIVFKDDRNTSAKWLKDGKQRWATIYSQETEIDVVVIDKQAVKQTLTAASGNDYKLLGHMPNYVANDAPIKRNFDQDDFMVRDGDDTRNVKAQGALFQVAYKLRDGAPVNSDLEIQENYRGALKQLGAQILFADGRDTVARLDNQGQVVWVSVYSQESEIDVHVIEEKAFHASIQAPKADALKAALDKDGHVALYINFDFDKATLKPDAQPLVAQIVTLLKSDAALKLSVEGHTDNVGGHGYNVNLSQQRAAAMVAALVAQGIAADRLVAAGFGPDKPIAGNETAEDRARNRRVELVKR